MDSNATTPVTVLTGFLGSGKTTLLNSLLRDSRLADTAVIINEFGEIGLDHLLVSKADENVVLLDSGCICCSIGNGLSETLETLFRQRFKKEIPAFKRVVVETTGLADPFPLMKTVLADYFVSKHFSVNGVLTTVDAVHGHGQLEQHPEARNQAAIALHIAVTKSDLVSEQQVLALVDEIQAVNPLAGVSNAFAVGEGGHTAASEVIDFLIRPVESELVMPQLPTYDEPCHEHGEECEHDNSHHHHKHGYFHHDARIASHAFHFPSPVSWQQYAGWLERLRMLPASNLMRVKGLLELDSGAPPYVIQGVQHTFAIPARLAQWPTAERQGWLVVIARGIAQETLRSIFSSH